MMKPWEAAQQAMQTPARAKNPEDVLAEGLAKGMTKEEAMQAVKDQMPDVVVRVGGRELEQTPPPWEMARQRIPAPDVEHGVATSLKRGALRAMQGVSDIIGAPKVGAVKGADIPLSRLGLSAETRHKQLQEQINALPQHPEWQGIMEEAGKESTLTGAGKKLLEGIAGAEDTTGLLVEQTAELLPQMATMVLGTAGASRALPWIEAGMKKLTASMAGGGFLSSVANTYGPNVEEALQKGMEFDQARARAALQSAAQGGVDALTSAVIPWKIGPNQFTNIPAQTLLQVLGGASGEVLRKKVVGEEAAPADVAAEGLLELLGVPGDVVASVVTRKEGGSAVLEEVPEVKPWEEAEKAQTGDMNAAPATAPASAPVDEDLITSEIEKLGPEATKEEIDAALKRTEAYFQSRAGEPMEALPGGIPQEADNADRDMNSARVRDALRGVRVTSGAGKEGTDALGTGKWAHVSPEAVAQSLEEELANEFNSGTSDVVVQEAAKELIPLVDQLREGKITPEELDAYVRRMHTETPTMSSMVLERIYNRAAGVDLGAALDEAKPGDVLTVGFNERKDTTATLASGEVNPIMQLRAREAQIRQLGERALRDWIQRFMPDEKAVLVDSRVWDRAFPQDAEANGSLTGEVSDVGDGVAMVRLNYRKLAQKIDAGMPLKAAVHSVLAHEFGHLIHKKHYQNAPPEVKYALLQDYYRWARRQKEVEEKGLKWKDWTERRDAIKDWLALQQRENEAFQTWDEFNPAYWYSFSEYLAQQTARYLDRQATHTGPVAKFYKKLAKALRDFYYRNKKWLPQKSVEAWLDSLQLQQMQKRMLVEGIKSLPITQAMRGTDPAIVQHALDAIDKAAGGGTVVAGTVEGMLEDKGPAPGLSKFGRSHPARSIARYNSFMDWSLTLLQILRENKDVPGVKRYVEAVRRWWADKNELQLLANERAKEIAKLKDVERERFAKFVHEMTILSDEKERKLTAEEIAELQEKHRLGDEAMRLVEATAKDYELIIRQVMQVLKDDLPRRFKHLNEYERDLKIQEQEKRLDKELRELLNRNYWPLSRFGQYWVQAITNDPVEVDGRKFNGGETFLFETYETEAEARERVKKLEERYPDRVIVRGGIFSDAVMSFQGMPPQLVKKIRNMMIEQANDPSLSEEERLRRQEEVKASLTGFDEMLHNLAPGRSFLNRLQRRKGTPGYSMDVLRGYASYMQTASNHLARIRHYGEMMDALEELHTFKGRIQGYAGAEGKLEMGLRRHYKYAMNPGEEWANLRALGFLFYLGLLVKSAVVNLAQVPMVAFPWLSKRHGSGKVVKELSRAMKDMPKIWEQGATRGAVLEPELNAAISQGVRDGFLSESLATELAAMAEGSNLQRLLPGSFLKSERAARAIRGAADWGSYLFQKMEQMNRYQVFAAAYRLSRDAELKRLGVKDVDAIEDEDIRKGVMEKAYEDAREAVDSTQFEYARWNRPRIMRGRKSAFFLFKQYLQNMLYFIARDEAKWRLVGMLGLVAGVSGLPGAEDLKDLMKIFFGVGEKIFGTPNLAVDAEKDLRKFIQDLGVNPDLVMHGMSRYTFGLWDLSGSLGMGEVVPGLGPASDIVVGTKTWQEAMPKMMEEVGGPLLSIPMQILASLSSNSPDTHREVEKMMPKFAASISKAIRMWKEENATDFLGDPIGVEFDPTDTEHNIELIGQAFGFPITRVNRRTEMLWAQKESIAYWMSRREWLLREYAYAVTKGNRESMADINKAINRYNKKVPDKTLIISGRTRKESVKGKMKRRGRKALGLPQGRQGIGIAREYQDAWGEQSP